MAKCTIPLTACESSQMKAVGYDAATKTLAIRFNPTKTAPAGSVYTYSNVPPDVFAEFQGAESKGKFFGERIKGHADKFPFTRMDDEDAT